MGLGIYASTKSTSISSGGGIGGGQPAGDIVYTEKIQAVSNKTFPNTTSITTKHFSSTISSSAPTITGSSNCDPFLRPNSTDTCGGIIVTSPAVSVEYTVDVTFATPFANIPLAIMISPGTGNLNAVTTSAIPNSNASFKLRGLMVGLHRPKCGITSLWEVILEIFRLV